MSFVATLAPLTAADIFPRSRHTTPEAEKQGVLVHFLGIFIGMVQLNHFIGIARSQARQGVRPSKICECKKGQLKANDSMRANLNGSVAIPDQMKSVYAYFSGWATYFAAITCGIENGFGRWNSR